LNKSSPAAFSLAPVALAPVALALLALTGPWHAAQAQTQAQIQSGGAAGTTPDKSGYTLFNPTPPALLRDFNSDRPNKGTNPSTVDAGHVQYETDLLGGVYDGYAGSHLRTRELFSGDPVFKLGVTNSADVEVSLGGYETFSVRDRGSHRSRGFGGFGDVVVRTKLNLVGNDGGPFEAAVVPYYKIPTASRKLGNGAGEFGVLIPVQVSLPYGLTMLTTTEFDDLKNANDSGRHAAFGNLVGLSRLIAPKLTAAVEVASLLQTTHIRAQYTLDVALAYMLTPGIQLDTGAYIGLNKAAPDLVAYVGLSQRF
jgi:hypothetical protein